MNEQEMTKEEIENYIHKAVQSGKKETSDLVGHIMNKIDSSIEVAVQKHVNGNIKRLDAKMDDYIATDNAWKVRAEPLVKAYENTTWFGNIVLNVMKFTVLLASAIGAFLLIKEKVK